MIISSSSSFPFSNVSTCIDTGSATTLINSDYIFLDGSEKFINIYGVGGYEAVLNKYFNQIIINETKLNDVELSVGELDYGIDIDMLIGLDLLKKLNANINIKDMILSLNCTERK